MHDSLAHAAEPAPAARADGGNLTGAPLALALARGAWIVTTVVSVSLLVAAMPLAYQQLITPHAGPQCADSRFSPAQFAYMHATGISPTSLAVVVIVVQCFSTLVYVGVGALLFWRRADNRMALLAATALVLNGTSAYDWHWLGAACALRPTWPVVGLVYELLGAVGSLLFPVLWYTFPSGRWVPRWSKWLMLCWILVELLGLPKELLPALVSDFLAGHPWIGNATAGLLFATLLAAQVYRYQRVSTPAERLQTKWVVLGGGLGQAGAAALIGWGAFGGYSPTAPWWPLVFRNIAWVIQLFGTLFPISIGIALLRSRLFDVDHLINRVLVYGSLTGVLALLYLGGVIVLQGLVGGLTGQTQPLIVVITTLAIAALFQPLRRALQRGIDRRFYRRKYDAARTLAAFGTTLRSEVDLNVLGERLVAVVDQTMQPAHVSLWLRQPEPKKPPSWASDEGPRDDRPLQT
jgi:hypothetical protein